MSTNNPLCGRVGLVEEHPQVNAIAAALGRLATAHKLRGCVLISFTEDRIGVNSCGEPESFALHMERLGDQLLAAIDDGKFDPPEEGKSK